MQNMSDEHVLSIYKKLLQLSNETTQVRTDSPAKEMHRWQVDLEDALHHISPGKYELEQQRETATNSQQSCNPVHHIDVGIGYISF